MMIFLGLCAEFIKRSLVDSHQEAVSEKSKINCSSTWRFAFCFPLDDKSEAAHIRLRMIITLPSNSTRAPARPESGQCSFILHEKARQHYWAGTGALSIKTFPRGEAYYNVGLGHYRVDAHSYLILNQDQWYSIACESDTEIESFCLFFESGWAEEIHYSLATPTNKLLDSPVPPTLVPLHFFERLYAHDELLSPAMLTLRSSCAAKSAAPEWIREQLQFILQRLLRVHQRTCREVEALPALRATTREELYRRLYRAKDFIASSFDQPLTIYAMARVACLSPTHFLRTFRQVFQQTPHQFLVAHRLEQARNLLLSTNLGVTEICLRVGFESLGSFSALFRKRTGLSPEQFRRAKR
jgi:AraC family transcriptional regulator